MSLSEKIYTLRKRERLSQEQLAEKLNVSRQAISKWELGAAIPESDKIIALSNFFNVSIDYLLKDFNTDTINNNSVNNYSKEKFSLIGIISVLSGIMVILIYAAVVLINPAATNKISESSTITLEGNAIILIVGIIILILGFIMLLKGKKKN